MLIDLSERSSQPELMDGANVDYDTIRGCLRDLARVNVLSLGYRPTLAFLDQLRRSGRLRLDRPLEILDVGCGYGDLLREVDRWAIRHAVEVRLTGLDLNPWSARAAQEATAGRRPLRWLTGDLFDYVGKADIILSSLLAHHFPDPGVLRLLQWLEDRAGLGWFVNDLHRHPVPYLAFGPLAAALRLHPVVCHDGPVSFARAFRLEDWQGLLGKTGIPASETSILKWAPFRLCIARVRAP